MDNALLCPKQVADVLGISERSATRLLSTGAIHGLRVGRLWRTTASKVREYTERGMAESQERRAA